MDLICKVDIAPPELDSYVLPGKAFLFVGQDYETELGSRQSERSVEQRKIEGGQHAQFARDHCHYPIDLVAAGYNSSLPCRSATLDITHHRNYFPDYVAVAESQTLVPKLNATR
jgi:hypothetical protein